MLVAAGCGSARGVLWCCLAYLLLDLLIYVDSKPRAQAETPLAHPADIRIGNYEKWNSTAIKVGVVIVGGGVAGLTSAKTLLENGITDILLLEADHRLGGRVRTHREGDILVEEGAEWIHGEDLRLYQLANELQELAPYLSDSDWDDRVLTNSGKRTDPRKYYIVEDLMEQADINGILKPYYHTGYGHFYIDRFPEAYGEGWDSNLGQAWLHLMEKTVNAEEGSDNWLDISARDADNYVALGRDHQWKNGFDTLINYLKKSIPDDVIRTSSPVSKIFWDEVEEDDEEGGGRALIIANNGCTSYSAGHVIVTASVGHLKARHRELFQPSLPEPIVRDLNVVELGVSDKVQIGWKETWWQTQDPLSLQILWTERNLPKDMDWMYGIVQVFSVHQHKNVLQMFVTGDDARRMEALPKETVKGHVMHLLTVVTGLKVPEPIFFARSQWGLNPWTRGSYSSYVTVEGVQNGLNRRRGLGMPLVNSKGKVVVVWAGEHISPNRYGTVDGAMEVARTQTCALIKTLNTKQCKCDLINANNNTNNNISSTFTQNSSK